MSEQDKAFEYYWSAHGVSFNGPAAMELAFKEIAQKSFAAGRKLENEACAKRIDAAGLYLDDADDYSAKIMGE